MAAARNFRRAEHLPNLRPDRQPGSPDELPRQRNGITPQMHGRYPDFNVLEHASRWDQPTREVVLARLEPPEYRHFQPEELPTLEAFCDTVMAAVRDCHKAEHLPNLRRDK